jgi:hypothetical protein
LEKEYENVLKETGNVLKVICSWFLEVVLALEIDVVKIEKLPFY